MVPPDGGSRILFFSGGTALAPVAAELSRHTRNAVHVITTFDSGGSSAELRRAFDMPAVQSCQCLQDFRGQPEPAGCPHL